MTAATICPRGSVSGPAPFVRSLGPALAALLAAVVLLAGPLAPAAGAQDAPEGLPAAEEPPELSKSKAQKLARALKKLSATKPAARDKAREQVVAFGRGAIGPLLDEAATTNPVKQESVTLCLIELVDVADWITVERCASREEVALRRFAARKAGELPLPHLEETLVELLADDDAEVRLEAAIAVTALGSDRALGALADSYVPLHRALAAGEGDEAEQAEAADTTERIRAALAGLDDGADVRDLVARLKSDPMEQKADPEGTAVERMAAVALLRAVGTDAAVRGLTTALDDSHNIVQRDAINALRHVVEGAGPYSGASIFQQINEVKRLKEVLARR